MGTAPLATLNRRLEFRGVLPVPLMQRNSFGKYSGFTPSKQAFQYDIYTLFWQRNASHLTVIELELQSR
jgi:hypothetical protein